MELKFAITRDDYWQFNWFVAIHKMQFRRKPASCALLVGIFCVIFATTLSHASALLTAFVSVVGAGVAFSGMHSEFKRRVTRYPANDGALLGERTLQVNENGVFSQSRDWEHIVRWNGVKEIIETADHIFLFVDAYMAIIVPKRAFRIVGENRKFIDQARGFWERAHPRPLP